MATTRSLRVTAVVLGAAAGIVGLLHAPFARSLLVRAGGCPMAGASLSGEQLETARGLSFDAQRGNDRAPARPALGFILGETRLANVHAWAARYHVDCSDTGPSLVNCARVPAAVAGLASGDAALDRVTLAFDREGRLVNVDAFQSHLTPAAASRAASDAAAALARWLGPSSAASGAMDPAHLAQPNVFSLASVAYRFSDYVAEVVAMNTPSSGVALHEHYMAARD